MCFFDTPAGEPVHIQPLRGCILPGSANRRFPSVTSGFHEKAVSSCRSDVADRRLTGIRQGVNQASIRTLLSPAGSVQDRVRFAGAPQSTQRAHVVHGSSRRCAVTQNAICASLVRRPPTPARRRYVKVVLPSSTVCDYAVSRRGAGLLPRRQYGAGAVLRDRVRLVFNCVFQTTPDAVAVAPPLGGDGRGGSVMAPVPQRASRRGRTRSSSRSSTG